MQFDYIIQEGVWTGSAEQVACVLYTVGNADFNGFDSVEQYLHTIDETHSETDIDTARGPIAAEAWEFYAPKFRNAYKTSSTPEPPQNITGRHV